MAEEQAEKRNAEMSRLLGICAKLQTALQAAGTRQEKEGIIKKLQELKKSADPSIAAMIDGAISSAGVEMPSAAEAKLQAEHEAMMGHAQKHMNASELNYLNSIDPSRRYKLISVDKNGNVINNLKDAPSISGAQLREDFSRIKDAALPDEEKAGTLKERLQEKKEKLEKLIPALDRIEGFEAGKRLEEAGKHPEKRAEQEEIIRQNHPHFQKAKEQAQELIKIYDGISEVKDGNMQKAMLISNESKINALKQTLKHGVMEKALSLEGDKETRAKRKENQGVHVDNNQLFESTSPGFQKRIFFNSTGISMP